MQEAIFLNGRFLAPEEAKSMLTNNAPFFGRGVFETMRAYKNKIVHLDGHIERLQRSAKLIEIRSLYPKDKLKRIIYKAVSLRGIKDAHVRITLWGQDNNSGILIAAKEYRSYSQQEYNAGFSAAISEFRQDENSLLTRIKSTSRILYQLSLGQAKKRGFDEALILNSRGFIAEASRSNIFLVKSGDLFTPALACGCLDGITRWVVFDLARKSNIKTYEGKFVPQDLYAADEAFLSNSLMGLMPIVSLERKKIGEAKCGRLTKFIMRKYNSLLK